MNRLSAFRAIISLLVLAGSTYFVLTATPTLGLDLRGGTQIVLEAQDSPTVVADAEATDRAVEVLRRRVDALGVSEPTLTRSGERRIIVELPGVRDPREAAEVIGRTAQLSFHPVLGYADVPPTTDPSDPPESEPTDGPEAEPTDGSAAEPTDEPSPESTGEQSEAGEPEATETSSGEEPESEPTGPLDTSQELVLPDESGQPMRLGPSELTGEGVTDAAANFQVEVGGWHIVIDFAGGGREWEALTGAAACNPPGDPTRRVAIVLDGEVISSPQVTEGVLCNVGIVGGSTQITGSFSQEEAQDLAVLIKGGALPVEVETIEQRVVGPTLGASAIDASAEAAIIGLILTTLFVIFVYRLMGLLAAFALASYAAIAYAAMIALGATLTLPGLAGFVLAIGMAVDANVLVFERAREDYVDGDEKSLRKAIQSGFRNAFSAIADSNVTTLLAAVLLFFLASGPVRGFGVTLSIGVLASMFSALVISRVLTEWASARGWVRRRPGISGISKHGRVRNWLQSTDVDIMKHTRKLLAGSVIAVLFAITGVVTQGLNFGIEFTGGRLVEVATENPVNVDDARDAVAEAGFPTAVVQESGDADISVRVGQITNDEAFAIRDAIGEIGGGAEVLRDEQIGPSLGNELRRNAIIAIALALLAQLTYLAIRFRWTFGTGSIAALFQNVTIVVGIFAWLGKPIDGIFLAALLAIVGYTVNDSVVVFDRVRENWLASPDSPFAKVVNTAVLSTLPRTVNTGISTLFILSALLFLGGDSLSDFALALILGILIGTASSNLTAAPIAIEMEARRGAPPPRPKPQADPRGRDPRTDPNFGAVV